MNEQWFILVNTFVLGAVTGSFLNVLGIRIPKKEPIVFGRSRCMNCQKTLGWMELIPIFSYCFLRGKCKVCKQKISQIYPIMETICALAFTLIVYQFGITVQTLYYLLIVSMLHAITVSDIFYKLIPNKILLAFGIPILFLAPFADVTTLKESLLGFGLIFVLIILVMLLSRKEEGMGGGDIKLFMVLALSLGIKNFLMLFIISAGIGLLSGIVYVLKTKEKQYPFGPSIALATFLTILYGNEIWAWYSRFLY